VLAEQGAKVLPDPPIEFPSWLKDLRQRWAVEGVAAKPAE